MPTRTGYKEGVPSWADLGTTDVEGAKDFYAAIFGWEYDVQETDSTPYAMAMKNGLPAAGIGPIQSEGHPPVWTTYIAVDDADATVSKIKEAGGQVFAEPFDVMDAGRMAVVADNTGAVFGIWQAKGHFGAAIVNEHGGINWNELLTDDVPKAKKFYAEVFGHGASTANMPGGYSYTSFKVDDRFIAGAMHKPMEEIPNHWGVFFAVDDAAAAIDKTKELGGSLSHGPTDIPEVGIMAGLVDPQGAPFTVMQLHGEVT